MSRRPKSVKVALRRITLGTIYHAGADSRDYEDADDEPLAERELPRYRMPQEKSDPPTVRELIRDELYLDAKPRRMPPRSARR